MAEIHAERQRAGLPGFMGPERVLAQDPFDSPASGTAPTFARNPRVACPGDPDRRIALIRSLQRFRHDYRAALLAWRAGDRTVVFPHGTYALARYHGAVTARVTGPAALA